MWEFYTCSLRAVAVITAGGGGNGVGSTSIVSLNPVIVRVTPRDPSAPVLVSRWSREARSLSAAVCSSGFLLVVDWICMFLSLLGIRCHRTWYAGSNSMHQLRELDRMYHASRNNWPKLNKCPPIFYGSTYVRYQFGSMFSNNDHPGMEGLNG